MILIVSAVFPPEPVVSASLSYDLAVELGKQTRVVVLSPKPTRPFGMRYEKQEPRQENFTQVILNSFTCPKSRIAGRLYESISFGFAVKKYIKKNKGQISCIYLNSWPLFSQHIIVRTAKKAKIPVVLHIQDVYPESLAAKAPRLIGPIINILFRPMDRNIFRKSLKVVAISPYMRDYLLRTRDLVPDKIEVVRNWQNHEPFLDLPESIDIRYGPFTFMFLGSVSPSAGVEELLMAFKEAELGRSRLVIAGSGSIKEKCIELANELALKNVEFWDAPKNKVPEIQAYSDVLLLPLKKGVGVTATPSKLSAYMFSRKPIIACVEEKSDVAEIISSGRCGWVIPPDNKSALTKCLIDTYKIPRETLELLGQNGFEFALKYFSKERNQKKLMGIILESNAGL